MTQDDGMSRPAPNEEAKKAAKQARKCLFRGLEFMVENNWPAAKDEVATAGMLLQHLIKLEASYDRDHS